MLIGAFLAAPTAAQSPTYEPDQRTTTQIRVEETKDSKAKPELESRQDIQREAISDRPAVVSSEASGRGYTVEEVKAKIIDYSILYGIDPTIPLAIAKAESGYNCLAKNSNSSASGVFQFLAKSTWKNTLEGRESKSPFDCEANIHAAIRHMSVHGYGAWNASRHIWDK